MRQARTSYLIVALVGLSACVEHSPVTPAMTASGASSEVTVTAAVPDSATQDTTLDVTISGSSFATGAEAVWGQGGVPASGVRTNSTRFVNSRKLIANITIAVDAATGLYDVIVTNLGGKKGIGTELFAVKQKQVNPGSIMEYSVSDAAVKIRSDHRAEYLTADGLRYRYESGVCGVGGTFFVFGSGDATMDPDATTIPGRDRVRCGAPRAVTIIFDQPADGGALRANPVATGGYFHVFSELWQMAIGVEQEVQGGFNGAGCNVLRFRPDPGRTGNAYPGSDKLLALRIDETSWRVRTKPYPDDKAWCDTEARLYHLPFEIIVRVQ